MPIDPGIVRVFRALNDAGVETFESCQGGPGHSRDRPTVMFHGSQFAGWEALAIAMKLGLPVRTIQRVWSIIDGEPVGPDWEITLFTECYL
jgi:hypothetical protein